MRCIHSLAAIALAVSALTVTGIGAAAAAEPVGALQNQCPGPGGQGEVCATEADCKMNVYATICVEHAPGDVFSRRCEIPCEVFAEPGDGGASDLIQSALASCAMGETCVEGKATPGRKAFFCQPSAFRMDLNLLDQAVVHHIEGLEPTFYEGDCSLEANLSALLDQNGDKTFDIFDLDLCVLAFLEQPGCAKGEADGVWHCDAPDLVGCEDDGDCGRGLYCHPDRHACMRDCGLISSREEQIASLDRECTGWLTTCNRARGRCDEIDPTQVVCEADSQCPAGAYCLVGRCAPMCFASADCPGLDWYCSINNHCRAAPSPNAEEGFEFDPKNYAVRFARDTLTLNGVETSDSSPLVIMDLITKKQVTNNPSVGFGYRLVVTYRLKEDVKCLQPFVDCADAHARPDGETEAACLDRQGDCFVDDTEHWLALQSPFGTVNAGGDTTLGVFLDAAAAEALSPGTYLATVKAVFDNGDSDTISVRLVKPSPSGEYSGQLTLYHDTPALSLNPYRPLGFAMRLKLTDEMTTWPELLKANHIDQMADVNQDIEDLTAGRVVRGLLHGAESFAFTNGEALTVADDEIPFVGLYSQETGAIRMIGVIDIPVGFCMTADGAPCDPSDTSQIRVKNLFGRQIRRTIQFYGPFDESQLLFHGRYVEKITGMFPSAMTLNGGFRLRQLRADDAPMETVALEPPGTSGIGFPNKTLLDSVSAQDIDSYCKDDTAPLVLETCTADSDCAGKCVEQVCACTTDSDCTSQVCTAGQCMVYAVATTSATWASAQFSSEVALDLYLAQAKRRGPPNKASKQGRTTIFPQLWQFNDIIGHALSFLGSDTSDQQSYLNVYDFVSSRVLPCDPKAVSPAPVCIDEGSTRCGLALHQRAIRAGWYSAANISGLGAQDLFCLDALPTSGCADDATSNPDLFLLQEHNRFWRDLTQILKYSADRARADAFITMVRSAVDPFTEGTGLVYKADKLRFAMERYDTLLTLILGPLATDVFYSWPAKAFKQRGADWLDLAHTIASDRLGVISELMDLERRVFAGQSGGLFIFGHHMMQQEYLTQVYLVGLRLKWQGELVGYLGESSEVFIQAQQILNRLNPARNEAGDQKGVVFFENQPSNLEGAGSTKSNWQYYRELLVGLGDNGGLAADTEIAIDDAVAEIHGALSDLDALEGSLQLSKFDLEDVVAEICGNPDPGGKAVKEQDYCQYLWTKYVKTHSVDDFQFVMTCKFNPDKLSVEDKKSCPESFQFHCPEDHKNVLLKGDEKNTCKSVIVAFEKGVASVLDESPSGGASGGDPINTVPICYLDTKLSTVMVGGAERPCVGGEMASLLQERALLDRRRLTLVDDVEGLLDQMASTIAAKKKTHGSNQKIFDVNATLSSLLSAVEVTKASIEDAGKIIDDATIPAECTIIAGLAFGTDCPGKAIKSGVKLSAHAVEFGLKTALRVAIAVAQGFHDNIAGFEAIDMADYGWDAQLVDQSRQVGEQLSALNVLTSEAFNLGYRIEGLRYKVQFASDRYHDQVKFAADHLVGRESGYILRGDAHVREAADSFQEMVHVSYRLVQAFGHHFNISKGQLTQLQSDALSMVTMKDFWDFMAVIDALAGEYCGKEAIDCDWNASGNAEILRYSIREQLFSNLRDTIDGKTGKLVTAGEQFHALITQPPFVRRRIRGTLPTDQVELPFQVPVALMQNAGPDAAWLINPLECNQHLTAGAGEAVSPSQEGTVAVQIIGKNLGDGSQKAVVYEMVRGGTDYMRACHPESVVQEIGTAPVLQYPIQTWLAGYSPSSPQAQQSSIPVFSMHSQGFHACVGESATAPLTDLACWRTFARDRSLAAPDWKLVIPLRAGGGALESAWIAQENLPDDQQPVIEDIVIYFRYKSRPINED